MSLDTKAIALSELLTYKDKDFQFICDSLMESKMEELQSLAIKMEELELPAKGLIGKILRTRRLNDLSKKVEGALIQDNSLEEILILIDTLICNQDNSQALSQAIAYLELPEPASLDDLSQIFKSFSSQSIDYKSAHTCSLTHLFQTQKGMPVIISALAIIIANKYGIKLYGVNLPGHFIVAYENVQCEISYLDLSQLETKVLKIDQIRTLVNRYGYELKDEMLDPVSNRQVLIRIMNNLYRIWGEENSSLKFKTAGTILEMMKEV